MKLTIKNTIEDYRCVQEYMYRYVIEKNKALFTIFKILLYAAPWIAALLQYKVIVNREYFYIITFIVLSIVFDLLFYLVFKNNYSIKWLVDLSLIRIKRNRFAICDKVLEVHEDYIKIFNKYGEIRFNKKDKSEIIRFDKGLIITNKVDKNIKKFIFIPNRSFENDNEINQLINSI